MGAPVGLNLVSNYTSGAPSTQQPQANQPPWRGGHGALVITASIFPTTTILQFIARGGVAINVQVVAGNGIYILDLPAGQYQLSMAGGAASAVNADLVSIPSN